MALREPPRGVLGALVATDELEARGAGATVSRSRVIGRAYCQFVTFGSVAWRVEPDVELRV